MTLKWSVKAEWTNDELREEYLIVLFYENDKVDGVNC